MNIRHISTSLSPQTGFPFFFFNSQEYVQLHDNEHVYSFFFVNEASKETIARIHFEVEDGVAKSHWRAPFGCFETSVQKQGDLEILWTQVEAELVSLGVYRMEIRSWPSCFYPYQTQILWDFFESKGFEHLYSDFDFYWPIGMLEAKHLLLKSERKRLRKCQESRLQFQDWLSPDADAVFDCLYRFRADKNIPLNLSNDTLRLSLAMFPERYLVFTVKDKDRIVAVSVCVKVNDEILYHFCLSADMGYNHLSPSVLMYVGIYEYCQRKGFAIFDFGTASIRGDKQESLFLFKQKLGGQLAAMPTFSKQLT
jgi:hypothetical protein